MSEEQMRGFEQAANQNGVGLYPERKAKSDVQRIITQYTPVNQEEEPPVIDYKMKRFMAGFGFFSFCICCMIAADRGALDGVMNFATWVISIFLGIGFVRGALQK